MFVYNLNLSTNMIVIITTNNMIHTGIACIKIKILFLYGTLALTKCA